MKFNSRARARVSGPGGAYASSVGVAIPVLGLMSSLGVPSGASKTIYEPMVHVAQTVHGSCTDTNTVSKWKEVRFLMTHFT